MLVDRSRTARHTLARPSREGLSASKFTGPASAYLKRYGISGSKSPIVLLFGKMTPKSACSFEFKHRGLGVRSHPAIIDCERHSDPRAALSEALTREADVEQLQRSIDPSGTGGSNPPRSANEFLPISAAIAARSDFEASRSLDKGPTSGTPADHLLELLARV
jgi:hypothetical protein